MISLTEQETNILQALGSRLRARRIYTTDTQASFAARIGVSVPTYRKMETGDASVPIGYWIRALRLLGGLEVVDDLLPVALLSEARERQRAPRRPLQPKRGSR